MPNLDLMGCPINISFSKRVFCILLTCSLGITNLSDAFQSENNSAQPDLYFEGNVIFNHSSRGQIHSVTSLFFKGDDFRFKAIQAPTFLKEANIEIADVIFNTKDFTRAKIKHGERTVEFLEKEEVKDWQKPRVEITNEWIEVLGYRCRKYIVKRNNPDFDVEDIFWLWIAEELKISNPSSYAHFNGWNTNLSYVSKFTQGLMLRSDKLDEKGNIRSVKEAVEVIRGVIDLKEFQIPTKEDGYRVIGKI